MTLFNRQDLQLGSTRDTIVGFVDNTAPAATMESGAAHLADDLNNLRSIASLLKDVQAGNWYDDLVAPSTLEAGTKRGVDDLNDALHAVEKKRVLRDVHSLVDVAVGAGDNFVILGTGELPSQTTMAVGAVTTLGTVAAAHGGTFGTHALTEVAGATAIAPLNLAIVVDGASRDPILSSGRTVFALLQSENATDGHTATDTTPNRLQLSFVRVNATGDDLEACPVADIESTTINFCTRERVRLEDLNEGDFLRGAIVDTPAGATVTRQAAYDNQGATAVDLTSNATLDLEGAGLIWSVRDDLEADLFRIVEGSAGGTSEVEISAGVDVYDNRAVDVDFQAGASINLGGTRPIDIGVTDGVIASTAGDLEVEAAAELLVDDGNRGASTFGVALKLTETSQEWSDLESQFGEVSLASMLLQAGQGEEARVNSTFTANVSASTDVNGPGTPHANVDTDLLPYDNSGIASLKVFFNGELAWLTRDYVAGGTPADGDLQFTFDARGTGSNPDFITVIRNGANI